MIKESIYQEDIEMKNVCVSNNRAAKYVKQKLTELKGLIDKSEIIFGDFNILFSTVDRTTRQKISKDTEEFNITENQQDLTNIYRILHPTRADCILFPSAHGIYTRIHHILGHKTNINKFLKTEIITSMSSDYSEIKLEISNRKISEHL